STSKAQKEKMMTEFRSFTNAIPADASRICKKAGYRLEVAFELFYNDSMAQSNAERSVHSRTKAITESYEKILNLQFNEYQDPDEPGKMDMNGLMKYLEGLKLTPEDPKVLCLFYRYTFEFGRDEGQKSLALSTAIPLWELVLPIAPGLDHKVFKTEYLEWWFDLLRSRNKSISRDTWNLFLDFVIQLEDRFENYDEMAAWPSLIDDYVTIAREKLENQGMDCLFLKGNN
ncbi:hypothetical protein PSTT_08582, partial [Puccinia striiformis]